MIQKVTDGQLAQCARVIRDSFQTVADAFGFTAENAPRFTAFATTEKLLRQQLQEENRLLYAFDDNGTIAGYYSLSFADEGDCELHQLCVLPAYRHRGIGGELLSHAFSTAKAKGCRRMRIGIVEENRTLRKWYGSFGFVHLGTRKPASLPFTCGFLEKHL